MPIDVFAVPGAFKMPLLPETLARIGYYVASIAAAFVVNGQICRNDFVPTKMVKGLMHACLETEVLCLSVSLTQPAALRHDDRQDTICAFKSAKAERI